MATRNFIRTLTKSTKPPIQLFGIDGTYATALYSASVKDSSVDKSFQDLSKIIDLIHKDTKVNSFLNNPALSKDERKIVISTISKSLSLDKTTSNFLNVLSENSRLGNLSSIFAKFTQLSDASKNLVTATITSAQPLDSKILKRLQTSIQKSSFVGDSKSLTINNVTNPDILGGLIVEVGDRTVDLSISAKVAKINSTLAEAI